MTEEERQRLRNIKTFKELLAYLRDHLDWPIEQSIPDDDLTFDWSDDLGLKASEQIGIKEIKQLRPLESNQPWGIFFINFEKKKLPIVILRRILNALVMKKRAGANHAHRAAWQKNDLLFISAYGEEGNRELTFAHFSEPTGELIDTKPTLRVLGWDDDDTNLKLDYVADTLKAKLTWPAHTDDVAAWRKRWSEAFELRHRQVIDTAKDLALHLAELAKRIRNRAILVLGHESEKGPLRQLMKGFKTALIHDLDEAKFADMYAQTITYGLFSAAVSRTVPGAGIAIVQENVVDMVPVTNPFLKEMLQSFLKAGGRKGKLDFDELGIQEVVDLLRDPKTRLDLVLKDFGNRRRDEDPVIHFYEDFLGAYNKKLKVQRGVFYTPQPVVSYIVRSVNELLQSEFGLEDGLADTMTWGGMLAKHPDMQLPPLTDEPGDTRTISPDEPFVQILDPATGTATFLVEVIDVIHKTLQAKWKAQRLSDAQQQAAWNDYVPKHLLPRLHAFELMMAPYAIAHMKIGLKLAETGYRFASDQRARIYLTNALEPWQRQLNLPDFEALAHEAASVNEIKRHKRFTVVIGNPPYSILSANMSKAAKNIVEQYRFIAGVRVRERGALKAEVILQDDYVKFLGFAQNTICTSRTGIVGMITNANCYLNPVLRGVRYALQQQFQIIHALDLGGQSKSGLACDENVFDIDTGVAVSLLVHKLTAKQYRGIARVTGTRQSKYEKLPVETSSTQCRTPFDPKPEQFLFKAFTSLFGDEYDSWFPIDRAFAVTSIGIKTARDHLVLDIDREAVSARMESLRDPECSARQLRERFDITDNTQWKFVDALPKFRETFSKAHFAQVEARPFDRRWIYFHPSLVFNTRPGVNRHVYRRKNLCLLTMRRIRTEDYAHFFVVDRIGMGEILSSADNCNFFPLHIYNDDSLDLSTARGTNFTSAFQSAILAVIGAESSQLTPEGIFHYAYAVFHSPAYRSRYAEFLKIDFPRLPLTGSFDLFCALAHIGSELTALHLLESPSVSPQITEFIGSRNLEIEKVSWSDATVWIDKAKTIGFRGVREEVWNFHIGGYQVCEKWLKDRKGRTLSKDDIAHYHKIVVALSETIRLMQEIDAVIDTHGGWPDAFQTAVA